MTGDNSISYNHTHISGRHEYDSEDEMLEALERLRDIDKPVLYESEIYDLEGVGRSVTFLDANEENRVLVTYHPYQDVGLAVNCTISRNSIADCFNLLESIQDNIGEVEPFDAHVLYDIERAYSDIAIGNCDSSVQIGDLVLDLVGTRFHEDGLSYILQRHSDEEKKTTIISRSETTSDAEDFFSPEALEDLVERTERLAKNL